MEPEDFRYWAFISYSHQDRAWGHWLHQALETYRVPLRLVGRDAPDGPIPRRLFPVFRDRDELPSSADLGRVINQALRQSRYLIVICSPHSARSRWVNEEILHFKSLGRVDRVLCVIVDGEPWASDRPESGLAECFAPALRFAVDAGGALSGVRAEPVAADARGGRDGRAGARLKLIAGMLRLSYDDLAQRERRRVAWRRVSGAAAGVALAGMVATGWRVAQDERQTALAAQALQTRIAHLYESGRRELLAHDDARAAAYLGAVYAQGVRTPPLRFLLARAMRSVDAQLLRIPTGSPVLLVALSADGRKVLSVGSDYRLRVWDARQGGRLDDRAIMDAQTEEYFAAFGFAGDVVFTETRSRDPLRHRMALFDLQGRFDTGFDADPDAPSGTVTIPLDRTGTRTAFIAPDKSIAVGTPDAPDALHIPGRYAAVAFCRDGSTLVAADALGRVLLLDAATGQPRQHLEGLHGTVVALDSSAGCATVAAGTLTGSVRVWDARSGEVLMSGGQTSEITDLRLSADGNRLMTLANGVSVWDGHTGALIYSQKFLDRQHSLAMGSPDLTLIARLDGDVLHFIDPASGLDLYSLDGHEGPARSFDFSADGSRFASGGADGTIAVWRLPAQSIARIELPAAPPDPAAGAAGSASGALVATTPDGARFLAAGPDGTASVWDRATGRQIESLPGHPGGITAAAFSADGKSLLTGGDDQVVRTWDLASGTAVRASAPLGGAIVSLRVSPGGGLYSADVRHGQVHLFDARSGAEVAQFPRDTDSAQSFDPLGAAFVTGSHGIVACWDAATHAQRWSTPLAATPPGTPGTPGVGILAFSPDGTHVLATTAAQHAFVLDASNGQVLARMDDPRSKAYWAGSFSPDGSQAVFGDGNAAALLWRWSTGDLLPLTGHTATVTVATFSPDGALVLTAAKDGVAKLWDARTGDLLDSFLANEGAIPQNQALFSPDGGEVLNGGSDNAVRRTDVHLESREPGAIAAILRCRTAWRVEGESLVPATPDPTACAPAPAPGGSARAELDGR